MNITSETQEFPFVTLAFVSLFSSSIYHRFKHSPSLDAAPTSAVGTHPVCGALPVMLKLFWGDNPGYMSRSSEAVQEWSKVSRKAAAEEGPDDELPL